MLFFGCRHPEQDYLYADELKSFASKGVVELHTAFSRADAPKTYVQDLLTKQQERVSQLIRNGAIIYVCGDGGKMEPAVKQSLVNIYQQAMGVDAAAANQWIEDMAAQNRYVLDVWAGN
jgi:cytochrome P450/NADPH-cytochrome P450 reductase